MTPSDVSRAAQYIDLKPTSELKEESDAFLINIYLPDFKREQFRIRYTSSTRIIRVTGERRTAGNQRIRFHEAFPVPQNCEANKRQTIFLNGVLTIIIPKATITRAPIPQLDTKPTTSQEAPLPQTPASTVPEAKEPKALEEIVGKVGTLKEKDGKKVQTPPAIQVMLQESKSQKGLEDSTGIVVTSNGKDGKKVETPTLQESKSPKGQGDEAASIDEISDVKKSRESIEKTPIEATIGGGQRSFVDEEGVGRKRKEPAIVHPESDKESGKKRKESPKAEPSKEDFLSGKVEEMKSVATAAKDAMRGLVTELSEDRERMVYVGVAVLVIAAVGAYLYYGCTSSKTDQE